MPISRREFESAELDPSFLIEEFLRSNLDNAFTLEELIVELASKRVPLTREEMKSILNSLETQKRIRSKIISLPLVRGDMVYYMYPKLP